MARQLQFKSLSSIKPTEPFLTMPALARELGLPAYTIRRAAREGLIPTVTIGGRRRCRLQDALAAIECARNGGANG